MWVFPSSTGFKPAGWGWRHGVSCLKILIPLFAAARCKPATCEGRHVKPLLHFFKFHQTTTSILNLFLQKANEQTFQQYIVHTEILSTFHARYDSNTFLLKNTPFKPHTHTHTHIHTTILQPSWILSGTTLVRRHQKGKTRKVKPIWIYWGKR